MWSVISLGRSFNHKIHCDICFMPFWKSSEFSDCSEFRALYAPALNIQITNNWLHSPSQQILHDQFHLYAANKCNLLLCESIHALLSFVYTSAWITDTMHLASNHIGVLLRLKKKHFFWMLTWDFHDLLPIWLLR